MADMDPVTIAQNGVDPITGSPLSSEVRKALFKKTVVPSAIFGRGGALVKRDEGALVAQQTNQQIVSLQDQIQTVNVQVINLTNGLNNIAAQLAADSALERQQILADRENERKLNERKVRIGKENQLEAKITSALLKPIASIQKKVGSVFSRIMNAIEILFLGWLTNQGIEALKANAAGNKTKLQKIFQAIVDGVIAAGRGFLLVGRVIGNITRLITNITVRIAKLTAGLIGGIFRGIADLTRMGIEGVKGLLGIGKTARAAEAGVDVARVGEAAAKTAGKAGGRVVPLLGAGLDFASAYQNFKEGDVGGGALAATSGVLNVASLAFPVLEIPALAVTAASVTHDLTKPSTPPPTTKSKAGAYPQTKAVPQKNTKSSKKPQAPSQPQASVAPTVNNFQLGINNPTEQNAQQQSAATTTSQEQSPQTLQFNIPQAQVQTPQITPPNVGALPEPKPNLIMAQSAVAANNQPQTPPSSKPLTDVPLISSSNPDNFYTLYSQVNYNVVM